MIFRVRYFLPRGQTVHIARVEAASAQSARTPFEQQGQMVLSVDAAESTQGSTWFQRRVVPGSSAQEWVLLCRELRTLVHAGMTVVEAIDTLSHKARSQEAHPTAAVLLEALMRGSSLSAAIEYIAGAPSVLIAAVRAGERTSNLIEALDDFLRFSDLVQQLKRRVVSAAIYPLLVMGVGAAIVLFLMLVVMPKFATVYANVRSTPQASAELTIAIARFVGAHQSLLIASLLAAIALGFAWIRSGLATVMLRRLIRQIPWSRARLLDFELSMMYQALALMLKGGYPMTTAMELASGAALAPELTHKLHAAKDRIVAGGGVSEAYFKNGLSDEVGRRLMAAAERNGEFYKVVEVVASLHAQRFELFIERLTRIVEPVLLLAVALAVGSVVLMMYAPVFDLATQLQ